MRKKTILNLLYHRANGSGTQESITAISHRSPERVRSVFHWHFKGCRLLIQFLRKFKTRFLDFPSPVKVDETLTASCTRLCPLLTVKSWHLRVNKKS